MSDRREPVPPPAPRLARRGAEAQATQLQAIPAGAVDRRISQPRRVGRRDRSAGRGRREAPARGTPGILAPAACRTRQRSSSQFSSAGSNEALLVAYSAMSPLNLKAVDQVVKIVRELDRYSSAFAAEWDRPNAPELDAPDKADAAFARAWLCAAEPALEDVDPASPGRAGGGHPAKSGAKPLNHGIHARNGSAAGAGADRGSRPRPLRPADPPPPTSARACRRRTQPPHRTAEWTPQTSSDAPSTASQAAAAREARTHNPLQSVEKVKSAPGNWAAGVDAQRAADDRPAPVAAPSGFIPVPGLEPIRTPGHRGPTDAPAASATAAGRPQNPAQSLKTWNPRPETTGPTGWPSSPPSRPPSPGRLWTPRPPGGARRRDGAIRRPGRGRATPATRAAGA